MKDPEKCQRPWEISQGLVTRDSKRRTCYHLQPNSEELVGRKQRRDFRLNSQVSASMNAAFAMQPSWLWIRLIWPSCFAEVQMMDKYRPSHSLRNVAFLHHISDDRAK